MLCVRHATFPACYVSGMLYEISDYTGHNGTKKQKKNIIWPEFLYMPNYDI